MATKIKMNNFSVFGDLDGMTVGNLKKMLDSYPDDAKIVGKTESNPPFGGGSYTESEYFSIEWEE